MSEAHRKELNVLTSYRLNDFKKKAGATHVDMSGNIRRAAFTLAEVLITLGIIGVVAAMTIPTLIADYQEKVTVNKLIQTYSILSNAYGLIKVNEGAINTWFGKGTLTGTATTDDDGNTIFDDVLIKNMDAFWDKFVPYLKVAKRCKSEDSSCEKYDKISSLDGAEKKIDLAHISTITLTNGVTLLGGFINGACFSNPESVIYCVDFAVDINGMNARPNTLGKDIFYFYIPSDGSGILPLGRDLWTFEDTCNPSESNIKSGYGCTAWVIENKNLDYLKCFDELSFDSKHSCDE